MTDSKIQTVQDIYAAFGRADVATILDCLTEDVDWASEPDQDIAPWHGVHKGKGEVPAFFASLGEHVEVLDFTPLAFASSDEDVMAVVQFGMRIPRTGKSGHMHLHHWFTFRDGKVCRYRGTEDTALTAELLKD